MKIKNKKNLAIGILFIFLGISIIAVRFMLFPDAVHGRLKPIITSGIILFVGICYIILVFQNNSRDTKREGE